MTFVGLDPQAASDLVARFDRAVHDLEQHAQVIEGLFAQAGHPGASGAPGTMRHVAAWADYRRRDLQKRIDKVLVADSGSAGATPTGFRFATAAEAAKVGKAEADKIKKLLDAGKYKQLEAELEKVKHYANDPNFAAAFLQALGSKELAKLTKKVLDKDGDHAQDDLAGVARMLAVLTNMSAKGTLPSDIQKTLADDEGALLKPDMVDALATLLSVGGFSSQFTADAARVILVNAAPMPDLNPSSVAPPADEGARLVAMRALAADPTAAYLFVMPGGHADDAAIRVLLDPDPIAPLSAAPQSSALAQWGGKVLQAALVGYRNIAGPYAADGALIGVIHAVGGGASVSAPAQEAIASALRAPIVDGRIGMLMARTPPGDAPRFGPRDTGHNETEAFKADLRDTMAAIMGDPVAAGTLMTAARDYTVKMLQGDMAKVDPRDPKDVPDLANENAELGGTYGLLDAALAKHLNAEASAVHLEAGMFKKAGEVIAAAGLAATPLTGGMSAVAGSGATAGIDTVVDAFSDRELQQIYAQARNGQEANLEYSWPSAVALAAYQNQRLRPPGNPPTSWVQNNYMVTDDTQLEELKGWLGERMSAWTVTMDNTIRDEITKAQQSLAAADRSRDA